MCDIHIPANDKKLELSLLPQILNLTYPERKLPLRTFLRKAGLRAKLPHTGAFQTPLLFPKKRKVLIFV